MNINDGSMLSYVIFNDLTLNSLFTTEALEKMRRKLFHDGFPVVNIAALAKKSLK